MDEQSLRVAICEVGKLMYKNRYISATDGNISARLNTNVFLCTPSGVSKGFLHPEDIVIVDISGKKLSGERNVSTEFFTHIAAYEERPDINAVCHAHPPKAIVCSLMGISLSEPVLPELVMSLGKILTTPYATPASREGNIIIRDYIRECDALIIAKHGTITVGEDVYDAYFKLEKLEHAAEILLLSRFFGDLPTLTDEEVLKLREAHQRYKYEMKLFQN